MTSKASRRKVPSGEKTRAEPTVAFYQPKHGEIRDLVARAAQAAAALLAKQQRTKPELVELQVDALRTQVESEVGLPLKPSSFRSSLQTCKEIERVRRGVYKLRIKN